jgi:hypothetical protein
MMGQLRILLMGVSCCLFVVCCSLILTVKNKSRTNHNISLHYLLSLAFSRERL